MIAAAARWVAAPVVRGIDGLGDVALLVGAAALATYLLRVARQRLLWRVRRQLVLSYIFIGVVPALLLVAFFLLAGVLLFANVGSYLIQSRVRTLIDEVRVTAEGAARTIAAAERTSAARVPAVGASGRGESASGTAAGGSGARGGLAATSTADARRGAAEAIAARTVTYPGASLEVLPAPTGCRAGAASVAAPAGTPGRTVSNEAMPISAGPWTHASPPSVVPEWVPCGGVTTLVTTSSAGNGTRASQATVRAVVPLDERGGSMLVFDVPLGDALLRRIGDDTGTQLGGMAALPVAGPNDVPADDPDPDLDPELLGGTGASGGRLTDVLRWVAFLDYTDWTSGGRGTVGLTIGLSIPRLYNRISSSPLASLGNFSFGQLLVAGLLVVAGLFLIIQSVAFVMGLVLARSITGSVHELFEGTERVRAGDFSHRIPVQRRDQLGELAESFNTMTASIETLLVERDEKQRLEQELAVARQIQMSLLPQEPLRLPGIVVGAHCEPAREVGGDYYDFLPLGPDRAGILIADVAGKGTFAALYMAELKGVIHSLSRTAASPRQLLVEANRIIAPHLDDRSFITMTYAVLDSRARTFTYARAGHCPLLYVPADGGEGRSTVMAPNGMVLGLKVDDGATFERLLEEVTLPLQPGDVLVLFTDGISEAMNPDGECFGEQRLMRIVEEAHGTGVDDMRARIIGDIQRFSAGAPQHDDMTMLVLEVGGEAA